MNTMNIVTISLGKPVMAPILIPVKHIAKPLCINEPFIVNGIHYKVTCVSFGTPHGVVPVENVDEVDVQELGFALGTHTLFPEGASIVFIQPLGDDHFKARLWQRGEGETAFSPEAGGVAGIAAIILQKIWNGEATVTMGGNTFHVKWNKGADTVDITGPADLMMP